MNFNPSKGFDNEASERIESDFPSNTSSISLRKGKWTVEEENYANKIIYMFNKGILQIPTGTTLRSYLSEKLHWYVSFLKNSLLKNLNTYE